MKLEQIVADTLKVDISEINDETSPQTCGNWTSLKHILLIKQISKIFGINISVAEIKNLRNVGAIKQFLKDKGVFNE